MFRVFKRKKAGDHSIEKNNTAEVYVKICFRVALHFKAKVTATLSACHKVFKKKSPRPEFHNFMSLAI